MSNVEVCLRLHERILKLKPLVVEYGEDEDCFLLQFLTPHCFDMMLLLDIVFAALSRHFISDF